MTHIELSTFTSEQQVEQHEDTLSQIVSERMGVVQQISLYCTAHVGLDRREGVRHHTSDLIEDFDLLPSTEFIEYRLTLATEGAEYPYEGEVCFALPERSKDIGLFYNLYLPEPQRGYGLGRTLTAIAFDIFPQVDTLLAIPATPEGKRLLNAFGAESVEKDDVQRDWHRVTPAVWKF